MVRLMRLRWGIVSVIAAIALAVTLPEAGVAEAPAPRSPVRVEVTGDPTPVETLHLAIVTTARAAAPEARGDHVALAHVAPPLAPLPAASGTAVRAVAQITAPQFRPATRAVPVEIVHTIFPWSDAQVLLVSNSPETLAFSKVLFSGALEPSKPARLLYHHQNGSTTRRMTLTVTLSNPTRREITVWVAGANPSSGSDELVLGHRAARGFLDQYWHHAGFLLKIPANTTISLFVHQLSPLAIASGLAQLALVAGDRLNLQVVARMEDELDPPTESYLPNADRVHQRGVFDEPELIRTFHYAVGGPPVMMTIGDDREALRERETGEILQGNYGVIYTFSLQISNPTPAAATLGLMMRAAGGQAGGVLLVDDRILEVPRLKPTATQLVTSVRLSPGERRVLAISTMPESGANYPVVFTLGAQ